MARRTLRAEDLPLLSAEWTRENVTTQGPLGALYRVWGDGIQMVPGDLTDYFHLSGQTADELRAQGYGVWMDPQPAGEWISEGDTTNMLPLLVPGLRGHENPAFGGWGGRYERTPDGTDTWGLTMPRSGRVARNGRAAVHRPATKARSRAGSPMRRPTSPRACDGA